jgi:hypothetical protein
MIWRTMLCVITTAVVFCGCGGRDKPLDQETDLAQFFGGHFRAPKDRSVRIQARPTSTLCRAGEAVEFGVILNNASKSPRTLPLGIETPEGIAYTYLSAAVKAPDGKITRVALAPQDAQGELCSLNFDGYGMTTETIDLSSYYEFGQSGTYEVVLFYTVKEGQLPDGSEPAWTGTVWTSPIGIQVE